MVRVLLYCHVALQDDSLDQAAYYNYAVGGAVTLSLLVSSEKMQNSGTEKMLKSFYFINIFHCSINLHGQAHAFFRGMSKQGLPKHHAHLDLPE